jgi:hypothetical protein
MWQANRAHDAEMRQVFAAIAVDESRHAALAWQVGAWAERRLDARAVRAVRAARTAAADELGRELANEPHPDLHALAGLPGAAAASVIFERLRPQLWQA